MIYDSSFDRGCKPEPRKFRQRQPRLDSELEDAASQNQGSGHDTEIRRVPNPLTL